MKKLFIAILLYLVAASAYSQVKIVSENMISIAEELAAGENDQEAVVLYIEQLHELAENPVKINSADETEISRLFFLSDFQAKALKDHITNSGKCRFCF